MLSSSPEIRRRVFFPAYRRFVLTMPTVEEKKAVLMKGFGLNDKGATDALKNEELTDILLRLNEKFGASKLMYAAGTKGTTDEHR